MRILIDDLDYILTVDAGRRVIKRGSIIVEDGVIARVAKSQQIDKEASSASFDKIVDGKHKIAIPGFVDTHVHTLEHLARGLIPDNVKTVVWTMEWAYPFYGNTTEEDEYISALLCCADMLRSGTTCFLESGERFPQSLIRAIKETGIRGIVGRRVMDRLPKSIPEKWTDKLVRELYYDSSDVAIADIKKTVDMCKQENIKRLRGWVTMNGKDTCSEELYQKGAKLSTDLGVGWHFHLASSMNEALDCEKRTGMWPISYLDKLGVLQSNIVLAHATMVADNEIAILKDHDVKISFCPGSALKLAKGAGPHGKFPELAQAGITISLGCDGASAAGSFDMLRQVYITSGLFKDSRMDASMIPAEQSLEMGTLMGARAVQWEDQIGSIEEGKSADITIYDTRGFEWQPVNDPLQNLVYSANGNSVCTVLVDGQIVVDNGKVLTIDEEKLCELASEAAERSAVRSGLKPARKWNYV